MRYQDGPTVEVEIVVDGAIDRVWPLISDISLPARFSDEFEGAEWIDRWSGPEVGARFAGRNAHPAVGVWTSTSTVVECDGATRFGWDVEGADGGVAASWRFSLEAVGGRTRIWQWARMGPAPSGLSAAIAARPDKEERIVARRLEEWRGNMEATLQGIKAEVESARS
jgi:hypothetical protein